MKERRNMVYYLLTNGFVMLLALKAEVPFLTEFFIMESLKTALDFGTLFRGLLTALQDCSERVSNSRFY